MEDGWAHATQSFASLIGTFITVRHASRSLYDKVGVGDMSRVVNGQADGDDYLNDNNYIKSQIPEVDQTNQEKINEQNSYND